MIRSLMLNDKKLYNYSVKYNYVGGKIFADGELVGTVTDIDTPVTFTSEKQEVTITVEGKPEDTEQILSIIERETPYIIESVDVTVFFGMVNVTYNSDNVVDYNYVIRTSRSTASEIPMTVQYELIRYETYRRTEYYYPSRAVATPDTTLSLEYRKNEYTNQRTITEGYITKNEYCTDDTPVDVYLNLETVAISAQDGEIRRPDNQSRSITMRELVSYPIYSFSNYYSSPVSSAHIIFNGGSAYVSISGACGCSIPITNR